MERRTEGPDRWREDAPASFDGKTDPRVGTTRIRGAYPQSADARRRIRTRR